MVDYSKPDMSECDSALRILIPISPMVDSLIDKFWTIIVLDGNPESIRIKLKQRIDAIEFVQKEVVQNSDVLFREIMTALEVRGLSPPRTSPKEWKIWRILNLSLIHI